MSENIHEYDPREHEPMPEGVEEAPPWVKTMAAIRWVILGGMSLFALVMILSSFGLGCGSGDKAEAVAYHCPMHPTYVANQPGDCPICGMSLVAIDKQGQEIQGADSASATDSASGAGSAPAVRYICPMDPEVVSDQPGTCPKCGMDLEEVSVEAEPGQYTCPMHPEVISDEPGRCPKCNMFLEQVSVEAKPGQYTCPMHPEVISDEPGRCPKCNMFLEQVPEATEPGHSQYDVSGMGEAPVPGLVPITIDPQRRQLIGIRTGKVKMRPLEGSLRLVGYVAPNESRLANIQVRFSGWVRELLVDNTGQVVEKNDRLLSVYSQDLYQAEQDYLVARESYARASSDETLSDTRRQLLEAALQRLHLLGVPPEERARLDSSGTASAELWIRSPFAGFILEKNVVTGQFIGPDQLLFSVADLSKVWVLADVYERDARLIKVGQKVQITTTAIPGETFTGAISFVYPSVSEETRTLKVRMELANPDRLLLPGMYAEVDLAGAGKSVLAVPSDAVLDGGTEQYAFVVHDQSHFEPRLLTIGQRTDNWMQVLAGLSEGEEVVTSAQFLIDSESRLKAAIAGMGGTQAGDHEGHGN